MFFNASAYAGHVAAEFHAKIHSRVQALVQLATTKVATVDRVELEANCKHRGHLWPTMWLASRYRSLGEQQFHMVALAASVSLQKVQASRQISTVQVG
jgi:hypothetical protein